MAKNVSHIMSYPRYSQSRSIVTKDQWNACDLRAKGLTTLACFKALGCFKLIEESPRIIAMVGAGLFVTEKAFNQWNRLHGLG